MTYKINGTQYRALSKECADFPGKSNKERVINYINTTYMNSGSTNVITRLFIYDRENEEEYRKLK